MSTNYYFEVPPSLDGLIYTSALNLHIGKTSRSVMLQGYSHPWDDLQISSWQEWKAFIIDHPNGVIYDEYNIIQDRQEFFSHIETYFLERRSRQYDYVQDHIGDLGVGDGSDDWLDLEGFSVCSLTFS